MISGYLVDVRILYVPRFVKGSKFANQCWITYCTPVHHLEHVPMVVIA
jgi:hypothetical protein